MKTILFTVCLVASAISVGLLVNNWMDTPPIPQPVEHEPAATVSQNPPPKPVEPKKAAVSKPQKVTAKETPEKVVVAQPERKPRNQMSAFNRAAIEAYRDEIARQEWRSKQMMMRDPGSNSTWGIPYDRAAETAAMEAEKSGRASR